MTWAEAVPAAFVAGAWCLLPGLLVARSMGWRGIACWGSAPLFSVALIATTATLLGRVSVPWGPWSVVAAAALCAAAAVGARALVRRRSPARPEFTGDPQPSPSWRTVLYRPTPDGVLAGAALLAGMAVTVAIGWLTVVLGFGAVDAISPTYDAVHHYSAVARILATGDGSPLTLGEMTSPGTPSVYPAAWHDLVALVVLTSGVSIPLASNVIALAVAAVVWPLSCVLLIRQMIGRRPGAFLVLPILATAFTAMPWMLMTFGVLWPNLLGLALVPVGLAVVVTVLGLTRESAIGRPGALLLGAVTVPTVGLSHPNAAVSLLVLAVSPLGYAAVVVAGRRIRERRLLPAVAALSAAGAAGFAVLWLLAWSPFLDAVRTFDWPASMGARQALRGVLLNGMNGRAELALISVLVLVGAVFALRRARTGWLVPAHLTSGVLYVLAVAREGALTEALTGAWYNDSHRLAAMVPITGVPLATLGVIGTVGLLVRASARLRGVELTADRFRLLMTPVIVIVAAVLVLASSGFRIGVHGFVVAQTYQRALPGMLQPGQREFLEESGRQLAADAVVAANPWTGNVLLTAFTGHDVLFPHMSGRWTPAQQVIQQSLHDVGSDPAVCGAVRATGLTHVIVGPVSFWPWDDRARSYPGLAGIDKAPGFEPVSSGGGSTLYRITACDPGQVRASG